MLRASEALSRPDVYETAKRPRSAWLQPPSRPGRRRSPRLATTGGLFGFRPSGRALLPSKARPLPLLWRRTVGPMRDLNDLHLFEAVAANSGFSAASRALGVIDLLAETLNSRAPIWRAAVETLV